MDRDPHFKSNGIPVFHDISIKSFTTDFSGGIPSLLLIASASLSGSPGMSGPLAPGAGLVLRKTWIQSSICFLNSSLSMKPSICRAPKGTHECKTAILFVRQLCVYPPSES
jgi:hypothetical protein